MKVKNYMLKKENLKTVDVNLSIESALNILNENGMLSLPVMGGNECIGAIYKVDILEKLNKKEINKNSIVGEAYRIGTGLMKEDDDIEEASNDLLIGKTAFIPVYNENNEFTGILTHTSIFKAFSHILGFKKGTRITLVSYNIPGRVSIVSKIVSDLGGNILTIAVEDTKVMDIYRILLRVENCDINKLKEKLEEAGFKIESICG